MRIVFTDGLTKHEDRTEFTLSDDELENDNFITLDIGKKSYDILLDELYSAVKMFVDKRQFNRDREETTPFLVKR